MTVTFGVLQIYELRCESYHMSYMVRNDLSAENKNNWFELTGIKFQNFHICLFSLHLEINIFMDRHFMNSYK